MWETSITGRPDESPTGLSVKDGPYVCGEVVETWGSEGRPEGTRGVRGGDTLPGHPRVGEREYSCTTDPVRVRTSPYRTPDLSPSLQEYQCVANLPYGHRSWESPGLCEGSVTWGRPTIRSMVQTFLDSCTPSDRRRLNTWVSPVRRIEYLFRPTYVYRHSMFHIGGGEGGQTSRQ